MTQTSSVPRDVSFLRGDTPDDQVLTFDDIKIGDRVIVKDALGTVVDKGGHIREDMDSHHITIEFDSQSAHFSSDRVVSHERIVNKRLYKKKMVINPPEAN